MCIMKLAYTLLKPGYRHARIKYKSHLFDVLVADSFIKQALGLMYRSSIGDNEGMLFIFGRSARYGIWMHGMRFAIDIIWLDENKNIVEIISGARPCKGIFACKTYTPVKPAKYVLEIKSGMGRRAGMRIGGKVSF
ncbi:MAG: DUF192 domain-containing protein [Candidatus Micrarchaeaceae archaeon]